MGLGDLIGLLGILIGLGLLVWLAFRGWSVLLLAPIAAVVAAFFSVSRCWLTGPRHSCKAPRDFSRSSCRFFCLARYSAN